ncbi:MAG: helix-turn-helix transcriptional regulator [Candidatus Omnitrophica bacterium]|nr:helix-turn-helix transcriptional regulator [Candidatus Omnitrophota bacterium]
MEPTVALTPWRLSKGLTQKELAERTGLTQAQVSYLENGLHLPTLKTLDKLAQALHVAVSELLGTSPKQDLPLSRHEIDAIALAIVSGERKLGPKFNPLADRIASILSQKLNAFGAPGKIRNRGKRWGGKYQWFRVRRIVSEPILEQILARVDKSLA